MIGWVVGFAVGAMLLASIWVFMVFIKTRKIAEELAIEAEKNHRIRREKIKKLGIPTGNATDTFIWLVERNAELEKRVEELESKQ